MPNRFWVGVFVIAISGIGSTAVAFSEFGLRSGNSWVIAIAWIALLIAFIYLGVKSEPIDR